MRSAATHLTVVIRFIIFVVVVGALIFAVVHWAQNRQKTPQSTPGPKTSQTDNKSDSSSKNNSSSSQSSSDSNNKQSQSSKSDSNSSNTSTNSPSNTINPSGPPKSQTPGPTKVTIPSKSVPSTGLSLEQTTVGFLGVVACTYLGLLYWQSKKLVKN
jgi:cytoskeletal protein RodZ